MVPLLVLLNLGDIPGLRYQLAATVLATFSSAALIYDVMFAERVPAALLFTALNERKDSGSEWRSSAPKPVGHLNSRSL
ncbi:hypothetical protein FHS27_005090 [Rhodopirellula rubra]|uniref:Uncharacterized protein n=1 Tax=Aporhodopirellula rubra TaxID=980271 RepID=A0A7W5E334_9BACT|nr:hypothetical protein [Aporhodopirellula rubra]